MNQLVDERLLDEAIDAYVDWREGRAAVWDAYERWTRAPVAEALLAFSAYRAALDLEECAIERPDQPPSTRACSSPHARLETSCIATSS